MTTVREGFDVMFAAVEGKIAAVAAPYEELKDTLRRLWDAAYDEADPKRAEQIRQLAVQFCLDAGLDISQSPGDTDSNDNAAGEVASAQSRTLESLPGLSPAMSKILWWLMELLYNNEEPRGFQSLLERVYGFDWQEKRLSGLLTGNAASAAKDTPSWQQLKEVVRISIAHVEEGIERITSHPDSTVEDLGIPMKSFRTYLRAASEQERWEEAKRLLTLWFGLTDVEE